MKIVFQLPVGWLKRPNAEHQLAIRFKKALTGLKIDSIITDSIEEINEYCPDIIFAMHMLTPKLTQYYTIGMMWNPTFHIKKGKYYENIISYDGIAFSPGLHQNIVKGLLLARNRKYDFYEILPTSNKDLMPASSKFDSAVYIGSNWEKGRHNFFHNNNDIAIYGPLESWKDEVVNYLGEVPFDYSSVLDVYNKHGIGLGLHGKYHLDDGIVSMRPFEIIASGALLISDHNQFVKDFFGDTVLYVDTNRPEKEIRQHIKDHLEWAKDNKEKARAMISSAQEIFVENFTAEKMLVSLIEKFNSRKKLVLDKESENSVQIFIRTNGKRDSLKRSIKSIQAQTYSNIFTTLVYYGDDYEAFKQGMEKEYSRLEVVESSNEKARAVQFGDCFKHIRARYIGFLDDDDFIFREHVSGIMEVFELRDNIDLVYSGSLKYDMNLDLYNLEYFHDPVDIDIKAFIPINTYLVKVDGYIRSYAYKVQPVLNHLEDRAFIFDLYKKGYKFWFTSRVSSVFEYSTEDETKSIAISSQREMAEQMWLSLQYDSNTIKGLNSNHNKEAGGSNLFRRLINIIKSII